MFIIGFVSLVSYREISMEIGSFHTHIKVKQLLLQASGVG